MDYFKFDEVFLKGTKLGMFMQELIKLCGRYGIMLLKDYTFTLEDQQIRFQRDFVGYAGELLDKSFINNLKDTTMAKKMVKFTNKETNEVFNMLIGKVGETVYKLTHNVNEMNDAIRWCNRHDIGDTFDADKYSITLEEEHPVQ